MKTTFNPTGNYRLTYSDALDPAMHITDEADAQQYLQDYVCYIQSFLDKNPRDDGKSASDIARTNLGYWAGYYNNETRERVERLFSCEHPVFGAVKDGVPTPKQAFEAGLKMGQARRKA